MSRHRSRSRSKSPPYYRRRDSRQHYHRHCSPRQRHRASYNRSNYYHDDRTHPRHRAFYNTNNSSDSDRTHPGYSSSTLYNHDTRLRNSYYTVPVRIPDFGPRSQNEFGSRFQGSYQQTNRAQNCNSQQQQHSGLLPAPPTLIVCPRPALLVQQQQQQQHNLWGTRPPLVVQQQEKNADLSRITMTQLPFLEKVTTLLIRKIPADRNSWTTCSFTVEKSVLQFFKGIHATSSFQVQLRFCNFVEGVEQKDHFPSDLQIKVNGTLCPLPGWNVVPKQPARPVEITNKCDFQRNLNLLHVKSCTSIVMFVEVTRRLTHEEVLQKLLRENHIDPAATVARIKEKLEKDTVNEADITLTSLQFSLMCPVSKTRMKFPCRASSCHHLQCFDAAYYLKMNEKKPTWRCPICSEVIQYKTLQIDMHFKNILEQNISTEKVLLQIDGSCTPFQPKDVDMSILTLDDTLDQSPPNEEEYDSTSGMDPAPVTPEELDSAEDITIDLLSDEEWRELQEPMPADHAPSIDSQQQQQQQQIPEVVVLSDDETPERPKRRASLRHSFQEACAVQDTDNSPLAKRLLRIAKKKKTRKTTTHTTTPTRTRSTTSTHSSDSPRIDLPGTRMVLRSHVRTSRAKK